jgi:thioredoxin reductase (NADPH)
MGIEVDYAVVGFGVAAVAAALELARASRSVHLFEMSDSSGDFYTIKPTLLTTQPVRGCDFDVVADRLLKEAGVSFAHGSGDSVMYPETAFYDGRADRLVFQCEFGRIVRARSCIYAPQGFQHWLPSVLGWEKYAGRGVSYSASSDGSFFKGMPAAVVGCGCHAIHQAALLADVTSSLTLLCEDFGLSAEAEGLLAEIPELRRLEIKLRARIEQILPDDQNSVRALLINQSNHNFELATRGLFAALDPVNRWDMWGGEAAAKQLIREKRLFPAGLAAGVGYCDQNALYEDGIRAARLCLGLQREL